MAPGLPGALVHEGLAILAVTGAPLFATILVVGLTVGVVQAATQINDAAVGFLPRALAAALVIWLAGGWMTERLAGYLARSIIAMAGR
jgi:flagellar biosynthesis protein FliQ